MTNDRDETNCSDDGVTIRGSDGVTVTNNGIPPSDDVDWEWRAATGVTIEYRSAEPERATVNVQMSERPVGDGLDHRNQTFAEIGFEIEDGVATFDTISNGPYGKLFAALPVAERAVARIDAIESVEPIRETIEAQLQAGEEATLE